MTTLTWVGGSATWDTTTTSVWSPAQVPTAADDVVFNSASTYTVTMTGALLCQNITVSAGTVTFATGTTPTLAVSGSMSLISGTVWSSNGTITFNATTSKTITTNGTSITGGLIFNGAGGSWTLNSALSTSLNISLTAGTLDTNSTNNYSLSCATLVTTAGGTFVLNLNASTVNVTNINFTTIGTSFTFNSGTSTINVSSLAISGGAGYTFYDINWTYAFGGNLTGSNTFRNFTRTSSSAGTTMIVTAGTTQTVTGLLTIQTTGVTAGTSGCVWVSTFAINSVETSASIATINAASVSLSRVIFRNIAFGGAAIWAGTDIGNGGNNTGTITYSLAKNIYWVGGTGNFYQYSPTTGSKYSLTSGGLATAGISILPQDSLFVDNNSGFGSGGTITFVNSSEQYAIPKFNFSSFTGSATVALNNSSALLNDLTLTANITITSSGSLLFVCKPVSSSSTINIYFPSSSTSAAGLSFGGTNGTIKFLNNWNTVSTFTGVSTHAGGTIDLNGYTFSCYAYNTNTSGISRNITFNGGTLTIFAATSSAFSAATSLTTTAGSGTGKISMTAATAKTFAGSGIVYNCTLSNDGAGALTIAASNTFTTIANGVSPTAFLFSAGTNTTVTNWNVSGTAGNLVTIGSVTAANHTLTKLSGTVSADYLSISRSTATPSTLTWYAGANSTNGGNNTGWIFTAPPAAGFARSFGWIIT